MSDMNEKLRMQGQEFAPLADLLRRKFEVDAASAPAVDIDAIIAGTLRKRAPVRRGRLFVRLVFATSLLLLLAVLLVPIYRSSSRIEEVPRLSVEDAERLLNANNLKEVTILYHAGSAQVETDAPLPMVWVRKGGD